MSLLFPYLCPCLAFSVSPATPLPTHLLTTASCTQTLRDGESPAGSFLRGILEDSSWKRLESRSEQKGVFSISAVTTKASATSSGSSGARVAHHGYSELSKECGGSTLLCISHASEGKEGPSMREIPPLRACSQPCPNSRGMRQLTRPSMPHSCSPDQGPPMTAHRPNLAHCCFCK